MPRSVPKHALPVGLLAILLLSGCASPRADDSPSAAVEWPRPVVVHGPDGELLPASAFLGEPARFAVRPVRDRPAMEPTIALTASGTAFYAAMSYDLNTVVLGTDALWSTLHRTRDHGQTWDDVSPALVGTKFSSYGGDPLVYVDPLTDRLYFVVYEATCLALNWSDDEGDTWTHTRVCDPAGVTDHATIFSGPAPAGLALHASALYLCYNPSSIGRCQRSLDGGLTWLLLPPPFTQLAECQGPPAFFPWAFGFGATFGSSVYLPAGICGVPWLAVSHDHGQSWTPTIVDPDHGMSTHRSDDHEARVAADDEGNLAYYWLDETSLPRVAISRDGGDTWSVSLAIAAPGVTAAKLPAAAAGSTGRFAFLYIGSTVDGGWEAGEETLAGARWDAYYAMTLDGLAERPVFATSLMNPVDDPLRIGPCDDRCIPDDGAPLVEGMPFRSGGTAGMFDYLDLDAGPDGTAWAALVDLCNAPCPAGSDPWNRGVVAVQDSGARLR